MGPRGRMSLSGAAVSATCQPSDHARLKRASVWPTLPLLGRQEYGADDEGQAGALELRNCPTCESTLAVEAAL